jgi:hypothetical protein
MNADDKGESTPTSAQEAREGTSAESEADVPARDHVAAAWLSPEVNPRNIPADAPGRLVQRNTWIGSERGPIDGPVSAVYRHRVPELGNPGGRHLRQDHVKLPLT